jgi:hypothetical protein
VIEAEKVEDIEEAEAMEDSQEDSKAREAGTQSVQVPNTPRRNSFHMELEEIGKQSHMTL